MAQTTSYLVKSCDTLAAVRLRKFTLRHCHPSELVSAPAAVCTSHCRRVNPGRPNDFPSLCRATLKSCFHVALSEERGDKEKRIREWGHTLFLKWTIKWPHYYTISTYKTIILLTFHVPVYFTTLNFSSSLSLENEFLNNVLLFSKRGYKKR